MAENRFNVLSLWSMHPYHYMIRPRNFPEACPFNDAEMAVPSSSKAPFSWSQLTPAVERDIATARGNL